MKERLIGALIFAVSIAGQFSVGDFSHAQQIPRAAEDQALPETDVEYQLLLDVRALKADIARISSDIELIWLKLEIRGLESEIKHIDRLEAKQVYAPKSHWDRERKKLREEIAAFKKQMTQYPNKSQPKNNSETNSGKDGRARKDCPGGK